MNKKLIVRQNGYKDCGPSCLLSIMKYYGLDASQEEVSYILKTNIDGTTAYDIINGSRSFGFDGYGIHYTYEDIINNNVSFPIICHVLKNNMYHFIVIYKIKKDKMIIMDPSSNQNKISFKEFKNIYQNTSLVIYPIKNIEKINNHIDLLSLIIDYLKTIKKEVIYMIILSLLTILLGLITNYYTLICIDIILPKYNYKNLLKISILFVNLFIFKNIFNYIKNKYMIFIENKISLNINNDILRKYFNLPYQYFKTKSTGEIISRLNDLQLFKEYFSKIIINISTNLILVTLSIIILLNINKTLFLINVIEIILYFIIIISFKKSYSKKSEELLISQSNYEKVLNESIYGYETNKNLNMTNQTLKKIEINYISTQNKLKSYIYLENKTNFIKELITNISYIVSIFISIVYIKKELITIGEFMLFNSVIYYFSSPIKDILDISPSIEYLKNIYNRINDLIIMRNEKQIEEKNIILKKDIIIENLSYKIGLNYLLKNINLKIKYGTKILIYGKSGIGKSTIMKILMKYINEYEGNIKIGKINLKDISPNDILSNITYVSQNSFINNDTLKNNIVYTREITDEKYEQVLEICNLKKLRDKNKLRNNFMIEENGFNISGGERQKIILARSILNDFNYLILDESLSEIGFKEEKEIIGKLFNCFKDKTIIYISHKKEIIDMFENKYKIERRRSKCQMKNYIK